MNIFYSLSGMITVQIESADISEFISLLAEEDISVLRFRRTEGISAQFDMARRDLRKAKQIAKKRGAEIRVISRSGLYWKAVALLRRPVLLFGVCILLFLSFYLPGRVLFIRVEGNRTVPTNQILECAQQCGLNFGADRRDLRSEIIKNGLLERIGRLQWVGVNSAGCVATIRVQERETEIMQLPSSGVSSIVAVRDGIVLSCTGTRGNMLCRPGQAVKAGDVLISGYTDCGLSIRAEQAQGDIYARTTHDLDVIMPLDARKKGDRVTEIKKYGILFGKNRINFYKDSGILPYGCDKIVAQYYIVLPGGFQLPVAIVEETWYTYDSTVVSVSEEFAKEPMERFTQDYLYSQMLGGQILQSNMTFDMGEDSCILRAEFICTEMIGRERSEEIVKADEEDH